MINKRSPALRNGCRTISFVRDNKPRNTQHATSVVHLRAKRTFQRVSRMFLGRSGMENGQNASAPIKPVGNFGNGHVQEVVRQAHDELRQLLVQRAEVMRRIGTVKQTIAGLANLFGDGVLSEELLELVDRKSNGRQPGFTKACRMILMEAGRAMSARDVCDQIQEKIPAMLARHKDPMASVTTVLNRLVEYGEAQAVILNNGRRAWRWIADQATEAAAATAV